MAVADAGDAIFIPAIGARAGVVVREIVPGVAIGAVIFADGAPGALGNKRTPAVPVPDPLVVHLQAIAFAGVVDVHREVGALET